MKLKKICSMLLSLCMILTACFAVAPPDAQAQEAEGLIICQVYGGGGKGDCAVSHSFIELYNAGSESCSLNGISIEYSSERDQSKKTHLGSTKPADADAAEIVTFSLPDVTLESHTSYLVRCADENSSAAVAKVDAYDAEWADRYIDNEQYTVTLKNGDTVLDTVSVTVDTEISKQKAIYRNVEGSGFTDGFQVIEYKEADEQFIAHYRPKTMSDGTWTPSIYSAEEETEDEPAKTPEAVQVYGFENGNSSLDLTLTGRYDSGAVNEDGGTAEIVTYNNKNGYAYVINGMKGTLDYFKPSDASDMSKVTSISGKSVSVSKLAEGKTTDFTYGDATSACVSPDGSMIAVALQDENYKAIGYIAVFDCNDDGSLVFSKIFPAGIQPDMVTFDNSGRILSANEGEPREGYGEGTTDPAGSVTIVSADLKNVKTVGFEAFDGEEQRAALVNDGIVIKKGTAPSVDFEPEYIAVSGDKAYVSLQEANAIAVLDIDTGVFTGIYSVGFEDYSRIAVDINKADKKYSPETYDGLKGIRMPDGISVYDVNGKTYVLTANEGDSREWGGYLNEITCEKVSPTGNITVKDEVVFFDSSDYDGLDENTDYLFGGRSFTVFEVTESGLKEVFDSGSDFESKTAGYLPEYFNCSNDKTKTDNRSGKKGPEPETVITGTIGGRTYAFIALERIGGIMVYDITDPENATFTNYINSRDFSEEIKGDVSPEGLAVCDNMLLAANEVSGTVSVFNLSSKQQSTYVPSAPKDPYAQDRAEAEKTLEEIDLSAYDDEDKAQIEKIIGDAAEKIKAAADSDEIERILTECLAAVGEIGTAAEKEISSVKNTKIKVRSVKGKGYIKLSWTVSGDTKLDGYEVYRGKTRTSLKKQAGTAKTSYRNTNGLKKGRTYYYKVRGYRIIDGQKVYTKWSNFNYRKAV